MGIFDVCNFAYGDFLMVAGFVTYFMVSQMGTGLSSWRLSWRWYLSVYPRHNFFERYFLPDAKGAGLEPALATFGEQLLLRNRTLLLIRRMA